ncbi:helix-turn-helix domain-containing protein [Flavisphingomonas formosensis]|uniref:helix-turn-helix domain-containing protein n=1 Tax=Flavisphingomonas formosensis TaxID=861534 RepID=UPI0012FBF7D6|nr:helix-turn-helix domain-containing protein [Sphingomonas formosensis]
MDEAENRELFPKRVGERLAAARTAMGLELDEVAARTRVTKRQLAAIEAGDHGALPAPTYSAGFVKAYAQVVGLDGTALASDFRAELGAAPPTRRQVEPFEPADPARIPTKLLAWTALAIAIAIALAYALWRGPGGEADQLAAGTGPDNAAPAPAPAPAQPPTVAPPAATGPVVITATAPVWVRIYEPNGGKKYLDHEMKAGEAFTVPPDAVDPQILTGRPQSLTITVGDKAVPPLGPADKTVADVSLKPAALLARAQAGGAAPAAASPVTVPPPSTVTLPPVTGAVSAPTPQRRESRRRLPDNGTAPTTNSALPPAFAAPSESTTTTTPASGSDGATQPQP